MLMTRNQTKVRTETQNRGSKPCLVLFSERAAAVVKGNGAMILQLNIKGLTNANSWITFDPQLSKQCVSLIPASFLTKFGDPRADFFFTL